MIHGITRITNSAVGGFGEFFSGNAFHSIFYVGGRYLFEILGGGSSKSQGNLYAW